MGQYETIDSYKLRFDTAIDTLIACNCTLPSTDDIITKFIESLNSDYDPLKLEIKNNEYAGRTDAWPATLDAAYLRASKYITTANLFVKTSDNTERSVAFIGTASDLSQRRKQLSKNNHTRGTKSTSNANNPKGNNPNPNPQGSGNQGHTSNTRGTEPT